MCSKVLVQSVCVAACLLLNIPVCPAQTNTNNTDSLSLTIQQAEATFLEKNLQLLARHYNVEADKALKQQARLWDNPVLNTDQNIYSNHQFFEHGQDAAGNPTGQVFIQVQQLIRTAGKRGKLMDMAGTNADISQWQFNDVMRSLKQQLRVDFYTVHQLLAIQDLYNEQQQQLEKLLAGMKAQLDAGNIARKDMLRIEALEISLQQDAVDNVKKLNDTEAELRILLQITDNVFIRPITTAALPAMPSQDITAIIEAAKASNATYHLQQLQLQYQQQNLSYQKALAVPDVTVGPEYDHNSNYTPHYFGIGINLPLPVFNRNQGNIKSASYQLKAQESSMQQADVVLRNNVLSAYNKLTATLQLISGKQEDFFTNYSQLYNKVVESYQQRQLSLIEFIDYFQAYKDIRQKQLQLELNLRQAREDLNFQVGQDLVQ